MLRVEPSELARQTIALVGTTLYGVQVAERSLGDALAICMTEGQPLSSEEFWHLSEVHRQKPLGHLTRKLGENFTLAPDFEKRLTEFRDSRNRFVHRLFFESEFDLLTESGCIAATQFMRNLLDRAGFVHDVLQRASLTSMQVSGISVPDELLDQFTHLSGVPSPFQNIAKPPTDGSIL